MKLTQLNELIEDGKVQKGRWELTPDHELRYRSKDRDEEMKFRGSLIAAKPEALVVSFTEERSDQKMVTRLIELSGTWRTNSKNQLLFEVDKGSGRKDTLTFKAGWQMGEDHQLVYSYEETDLKTKQKIVRQLAFQGRWDLTEKSGLTYSLGADTESAFKFRGAFQTKSILAKKGEIRYQAGIEVNGRRKIREILFFGKWKVSRDLGLSFEIENKKSQKNTLNFGGTYSLGPSKQISVGLRTQKGDPLGLELIFTRDFSSDAQTFLRMQKTLEGSRFEAGVRAKF